MWDENKKKDIALLFIAYIEEHTIPIVAEFAYTNNLNRQRLYEWDETKELVKLCISKKEANLEKGALSNQINASMAIFSLKQLGWKDKNEIEVSKAIPIVLHPFFAREIEDDGNSDKQE